MPSHFPRHLLNVPFSLSFPLSTPAYDYAPNPDKQWILQVTERMEPIHKKFTDLLMTKRLQTLQSIDEAIERVRRRRNFFMCAIALRNNMKEKNT